MGRNKETLNRVKKAVDENQVAYSTFEVVGVYLHFADDSRVAQSEHCPLKAWYLQNAPLVHLAQGIVRFIGFRFILM